MSGYVSVTGGKNGEKIKEDLWSPGAYRCIREATVNKITKYWICNYKLKQVP